MMCGTGYGMVWALWLGVFLLFGFAYILLVLSNKETGAVKVIGQVIAAVIALIALVILITGSLYGGQMMQGAGRGGMMQRSGMRNERMMREMMKDPAMQQMMKEKMGK